MKNIQFKKALVALGLAATMTVSVAACSSTDVEETKATTKTEATEETTEETEDDSLTFEDADVQAAYDEKAAAGMEIEVIDASYIDASDDIFVEGFKATDGTDEYVVVKFSDYDSGLNHIKEVMAKKYTSYSISSVNGETWFVFDEANIEGSLVDTAIMSYGPCSEKTDNGNSSAGEDFFSVSADDYSDADVKQLFIDYENDGYTMFDIGSQYPDAIEGFEGMGENANGSYESVTVVKFADQDTALAAMKDDLEQAGIEVQDGEGGSKVFEMSKNGITASGEFFSDGFTVIVSTYG